MEYYTAFEKKEIMQYATTLMNTEDIILSFSKAYSSTQLKLLFVKVINNFHNPKSNNHSCVPILFKLSAAYFTVHYSLLLHGCFSVILQDNIHLDFLLTTCSFSVSFTSFSVRGPYKLTTFSSPLLYLCLLL